MIPSTDFSTVAGNVLKYYPAPNIPGAGFFNNYFVSGSALDNYYHYDARFDHDFSEKWHSFFRFSHWSEDNDSLSDYNNAASARLRRARSHHGMERSFQQHRKHQPDAAG